MSLGDLKGNKAAGSFSGDCQNANRHGQRIKLGVKQNWGRNHDEC